MRRCWRRVDCYAQVPRSVIREGTRRAREGANGACEDLFGRVCVHVCLTSCDGHVILLSLHLFGFSTA